ncbi:substrate-binding domain-containing protein [Streptomyces sp. NPDC051286]|uniref:substrate-binding domain-containing protein n=1 Tax=Streptomyces sp. NPDC051286 TaxID=3365647 RepID=UPI00379EA146
MPGPSPDSAREVRPTPEAVAAPAGVSRATASRVVNGGAGVRLEQVAEAADPPLTTVHQDAVVTGRLIVGPLMHRLDGEGEEPDSVIMPTDFIKRASA